MKTQLLRCFCLEDKPCSGNPAMVIQDFDGERRDMQSFAKASGAPACAFILDSTQLRFFYPGMESNLCIHAALCAAKILFGETPDTSVIGKNGAGESLLFKKEGNLVFIKTSVKEPCQATPSEKEIASLLNLDANLISPHLPCVIASIDVPKLLVPVTSEFALANLKPNLEALKTWSLQEKTGGIYAYAEREDGSYAARNFNPKTGLNEDIATGVSAGALASVLVKDILIHQGHFLGKPSLIHAVYEDARNIWVGGEVN